MSESQSCAYSSHVHYDHFAGGSVQSGDFDLHALYNALDEQRRARGLSWKALTEEVNARRTFMRPIAVGTITGLKEKPTAEGDGVLQMLLWLRRTPESFVPGLPDHGSELFRNPRLITGQILRWDTRALFDALDARRREESMTWTDVAEQFEGFTVGSLKRLADGGRTGFPHVMRLVRWLGQPAEAFTHIANW